MYEWWYSIDFEVGWYSCFNWTQFLVSNIKLRLDLGYRLLRFASRTNLESVPRFTEICFSVFSVHLNILGIESFGSFARDSHWESSILVYQFLQHAQHLACFEVWPRFSKGENLVIFQFLTFNTCDGWKRGFVVVVVVSVIVYLFSS